jgi:hypothetical protein
VGHAPSDAVHVSGSGEAVLRFGNIARNGIVNSRS